MKRFELFFTFIQLPLDYLALILAGFTAYSLRYAKFVTAIRPIRFDLPWVKFWPLVLIVAVGWLIIFALSGLYKVNPSRKLAGDLTSAILACSTAFAAITIYVFFTLQKFDSRFLVLAGWLIAVVYVCLGRIMLRGLKILLYRLGFGLKRVVIIGSEAITDIINSTFTSEPRFGYLVAGVFRNFAPELASQIINLRPDEILFTDPKANEDEALLAIDFANDNHLTFKYSADLFATVTSNLTITTVAGIPVVELRRTRLFGWGRITKRLLDIILSILPLIILSPVFLILSLIILLESGRPIIYKNERVGQYGKNFFTLKFRTFYQKYCTGEQFGQNGVEALKTETELIKTNSIKIGPVYKIQNDPRLTPFGRWLRRWSLDELPNLWNVLKGEMSLVGPRPHQPREVAQYQKHHKIVLAIKPGLTGISQVSGRSNLSFEDEIRLDTFYIEKWSLQLDFIILLKTPLVVISHKGSVI